MIDLAKEPLVSINEIARHTRTNPSTVLRWMTNGVNGRKLEGHRVGRRIYSTMAALARFVETGRVDAGGRETVPQSSAELDRALARDERDARAVLNGARRRT